MSFRNFFFIFILITLFCQAVAYAGGDRWEEPWGKETSSRVTPAKEPDGQLSLGRKVGEGLIGFFKEYISPVDGDRCPCYPTCAQYSLEVIRKHGFLRWGWY